MKILFVNSLYFPIQVGGAEKSVQFLAESLASMGHEVGVISLIDSRATPSSQIINGVKTYTITLSNLFWPFSERTAPSILKLLWHLIDVLNPFNLRAIDRIIEEFKPDVVHTNNLKGISVAAWLAAKKRGLPVVHTLRDYYLICPRSSLFKNNRRCQTQCGECKFFAAPKKALSKHVDAVTGISEFILAKHIDQGFFEGAVDKIKIFNAFPANEHPMEKAISERVKFGYIGRVGPEKGIESILSLAMDTPEATFLVAGDMASDYGKQLVETYARPNIQFVGYQAPHTFFNQIDILIVPSIWDEPFGRIIVEAYSYGVPVMGAMRGGIPELIEEGRTGFLFEPDLAGDMASTLTKIMQAPDCLAEMAPRCYEKSGEFAAGPILDQYLTLYEKHINRAHR